MAGKTKKAAHVNLEIDALSWGARKAGMSYGRYVSQIDDAERSRVIKEFKKMRSIPEAE